MAVAGLYRRVLPSPPAIEFASAEGKKLFKEALESGNMEGFFKLISYYQTQSEPAYCGLASLAMVLNALAIDPGRKWKGPWRWFDDSMLDCCEPLAKIKVEGISFGKVACLAHCNGAKVEAYRTAESTIDDFRKYVISSTSSEDFHVITSYHRGKFKQTGSGHFSPIGGYHAGTDMVLILDVARFKYPPHWIPLTLLWEAMDTIDEATGNHRGFLIISRLQRAPSILYTMSCTHESWNSVARYLVDDVPRLLKSEDVKTVLEVLSIVFKLPSTHLREFIKWVAEVRSEENGSTILSEEEEGRIAIKKEVLKQVQETELYKHVIAWLASDCSICNDNNVLGDKDTLCEIAKNVCCQGAQLFSRKLASSNPICCKDTNVKFLEVKTEKPVMVVSSTVVYNGTEQGVDMLVPVSQTRSNSFCGVDSSNGCGMHPAAGDILTVLLLALPQDTWPGLHEEFYRLVSTDNLPFLLQEEVLHLRRQLHFLRTECGSPGRL